VSQQPPPPPGREGPWPSRRPQGRPQGRSGPLGPAGPQRPGGPQPPTGQAGGGRPSTGGQHSAQPGTPRRPTSQPGTPDQPGAHSQQPSPAPKPSPAPQPDGKTKPTSHAKQPGPATPNTPGTPAQPLGAGRPAQREDRPTTFIPKVEETEFIPRIEDFGAVSQGRTQIGGPAYPERDPDEYQARRGSFTDEDMTEETYLGDSFASSLDSFADRPPVDPPRERGRTALRTAGEVLITCGMVVLLFVVYELYVTNIFSAQKQANATTSLNKEWDTVGAGQARSNHYNLADGSGIAKLYIPAFGQDYVFTVIEGTNQNDLAIGPGHYVGSALPGEPGNFAVAGHRVGEGAPFDDLGLVQSCDAILIETQTDWYVYRMLPMPGEAATWTTGKGKTAHCDGANGEAKVQPLGGMYAQTVGREIVLPSEGDVVAPIPHHYGAKVSAGQEASLLTLTTCNPKFSAAQRMILHAVLVKDWKKTAADKMPPEMKETS
jgi:sortase (surface protein transpeptidase)